MIVSTTLRRWLQISRPHIWLYTVGPFLIAVQLAAVQGFTAPGWIIGVFAAALTWPMNFFIFVVNDHFDTATDALNPKKDGLETRSVDTGDRLQLAVAVGLCLAFGLFIYVYANEVFELFLFWLLSILTYNLPPFHLKAVPLLDMLFAFNFPLWGVIGYVLTTGSFPPGSVLLAVGCLGAAFHLYSAIHDINYDRAAGVYTSAVAIGSLATNIYVSVMLTIVAAGVLMHAGWFWVGASVLLYAAFYLWHLVRPPWGSDLLAAYRYFIALHYVIGALISMVMVIYI